MSKIKNWMIEMQEEADYALGEGARTSGEVIYSMRQSGLQNIDEHWVTQYVTRTLEENELWERVEKQLVYNLDAQATIASVESGNVPLGIVYSSDALTSDLVEVILDLEFKSLKIEYPVAIIDRTKNEEKALKFLRYLQSNESAEIFSKFGFSSLE